jgi:hypothetical protein
LDDAQHQSCNWLQIKHAWTREIPNRAGHSVSPAIASKNSWALAFEAMEEVVTIATRRTASKKMRG